MPVKYPLKYQQVKLSRNQMPAGKGVMGAAGLPSGLLERTEVCGKQIS